MIRINLIRVAAQNRNRISFPVAKLVKSLAIMTVVAAVGLSIVYGVRWYRNRPVEQPPVAVMDKKPEAVEPAATPAAPEQSGPSGFEPSTHVAQKIVEEVVADVEPSPAKGGQSVLAGLSYNEMSRAEQINYEYSFAKNVLQILTRAVPEGIGFTTLSIDSFQRVSATGVAPGRGQVTSLFSNLRREKFGISNPPRSHIKPAGAGGFQFSFACDVPLGSNPAEPWLLTDHLTSSSQLAAHVRSFLRLAPNNGVVLTHGLTHIKTNKTGTWRRSVYHLSGKGSYRNFVKFVFDVHQSRMPCAFSMVALRARSGGTVDISADVVFTTR